MKATTTPITLTYTDELHDDFGEQPAKAVPYTKKYHYYQRNFFYKIHHWFWNRLLGRTIAWCHAKYKFGWRVENRQVLRQARKTGYFIYGNHTQEFFDAAMPKIIANQDCYVIVAAANITLPKIGFLVRRLGALPLLPDFQNTKRMIQAVDQIIADRKPILIYPEANIWPYYTKIRPFTAASFRYPVKYDVPAFCFTNTYQKVGHKVKIVTYIDGPFYPNPDLDKDARIQDLRDRVYQQMVTRSQQSNYTHIIYQKKEANPNA